MSKYNLLCYAAKFLDLAMKRFYEIKLGGSEVQRFRGSEVQRFRGSGVQRFRGSKVQRFGVEGFHLQGSQRSVWSL
jgi:hypothetical protein